MKEITLQEFLIRQPAFPEQSETDGFYLSLANRLKESIGGYSFTAGMPGALISRLALTLVDYLQDIIADGGLWRAFITANRALYGWSVPFHVTGTEYVDFELNQEDVRFLVWYVTAMLWEERRDVNPHDAALLDMADRCFEILTEVYDDAPVSEDWHLCRGLEFNDPNDHKEISKLAAWLFLHSYLLTPAFALSLQEIMAKVDMKDPDAMAKLNSELDDAMYENTTGPLALFTPEWVYLMLEGKLPSEKNNREEAKIHPYYEAFVKATGGKEVMFFADYESMNRFFIEALGWKSGEEHLSQAKGAHDYVLMVSKFKGMLMARDVARCFKAPDNPLYNPEYARENDFDLLTVRGRCPADLVRYALKHDWLPDAVFPGSDDAELVKANADFIARCFLQFYYRD